MYAVCLRMNKTFFASKNWDTEWRAGKSPEQIRKTSREHISIENKSLLDAAPCRLRISRFDPGLLKEMQSLGYVQKKTYARGKELLTMVLACHPLTFNLKYNCELHDCKSIVTQLPRTFSSLLRWHPAKKQTLWGSRWIGLVRMVDLIIFAGESIVS